MHTSTIFIGSVEVEVSELLTFLDRCGDAGKQAIRAAAYNHLTQPHIAKGDNFLKATLVFTPGEQYDTLRAEIKMEYADTAEQKIS